MKARHFNKVTMNEHIKLERVKEPVSRDCASPNGLSKRALFFGKATFSAIFLRKTAILLLCKIIVDGGGGLEYPICSYR